MESKTFETGKTYYTTTRAGEVRVLKITNVWKRKSTGERVLVSGSWEGKPEQRYEIKHTNEGYEYVITDKRYCTVICSAYEYNN